jgi:hypothetical protein
MIEIVLVQGLRHAKQILPVLFLLLALAGLQSGSATASAVDAKQGIEILAEQAEGLPTGLVYIQLEKSSGDADKDGKLREQVASTFSISRGEPFRQLFAAFGLKNIRQLAAVQSAELRLYRSVPAGQLVVAILVLPQEETATAPQPPKGMAATGTVDDFPTIYENNRSKFVFILNGGVGIFSDTDPWFGGFGQAFNGRNPTAENPAGAGTTSWLEGYIEPGLGGISQLFDSPLYAYGAVSYLLSGSNGQDIYNSGTRGYGDFEKLYAGLLWDLPGNNSLLDASLGKQVYQVRDGFLLSKIPLSTSIGERAALYLGPRLTSEYTALLRAKASDFRLDAFLIEPSELDEIASDTQLAGLNLQYKLADADIAFSYFYIPQSKSSYVAPGSVRLPREGLRTFNPSLALKKLFGLDGAWLKAEYAYQNHEAFDMSAQAGYAWIGYQARQMPWKPQLSYRWSLFSGDDPNTRRFERFDPLFSGGLGNFLPGIVFSKVYKNANLVTNRGTLSVKPTAQLELILDYFHHRADERNNLGGIGPLQTLASKDVGQEITLTAYNYIGRHLFLQGIASVGIPGEAIKQALGGDAENWYTVQAALYFFF